MADPSESSQAAPAAGGSGAASGPTRITVTEAARNFSDLIGRVRYLRQSFVLTRGGRPVAELRPLAEPAAAPAPCGDAGPAAAGAGAPERTAP